MRVNKNMPTYGNKNFRNIGTGGTNIYQRLSSGGGSGGSGSGNIVASLSSKTFPGGGFTASSVFGTSSDPVNFPHIGRATVDSYANFVAGNGAAFQNKTDSWAILCYEPFGDPQSAKYWKVDANNVSAYYGSSAPVQLGNGFGTISAGLGTREYYNNYCYKWHPSKIKK